MRPVPAVLMGGAAAAVAAPTAERGAGLDTTALLVAALLVAGNALFVAVEFSLLAANRGEIDRRAEQGSAAARVARSAMRDLSVELTTCQLGITLLSLVLGYVAEPAIGHALEDVLATGAGLPPGVSRTIGLIVALTIVTMIHMVIGEMVPKNIALASPDRTLVLLAPANRLVTLVARPAVIALNRSANVVARLFGVQPANELSEARTSAELAVLVNESGEGGVLDAGEQELLTGAIQFAGVHVGEVMVPRGRVVALAETATVAQAEELVMRSGHSRLLVTAPGPDPSIRLDRVVGFVHAKDLLAVPPDQRHRALPESAIRAPLTVTDELPIDDVLAEMNRRRSHVAVVVDRDGGTAGLVTLEDLLEAIVGDIIDETDRRRA